MPLLSDVFFVLTDNDHKSGINLQCSILAHIYELSVSEKIRTPLLIDSTSPPVGGASISTGSGGSGRAALEEFTKSLLAKAFPHLMP